MFVNLNVNVCPSSHTPNVAVPGRNQTLFRCVSGYCVQSDHRTFVKGVTHTHYVVFMHSHCAYEPCAYNGSFVLQRFESRFLPGTDTNSLGNFNLGKRIYTCNCFINSSGDNIHQFTEVEYRVAFCNSECVSSH